MYQVLIKIPKASYNEETITPATIIADAYEIENEIGQISVSNDNFDIVGYMSETDNSSQFDFLKITYEDIDVMSTEIIETE